MNWHDIIFFVGIWIFAIALIPTVISKDKPPIKTSLSTAIVMTIFAVNYFSLTLYLSALTSTVTAGLWYVIAYQKYQQKKK